MTLNAGAFITRARYAMIASSHRWLLYSASADASSACRSFAARLPSALVGAATLFFNLNSRGLFGCPTVRMTACPAAGSNPGACALKSHAPALSPMIAKRPLSSVVAVRLVGEAVGFSAITVAPLIGWPVSSLTVPPTRPICAAASTANAATNRAARMWRIRGSPSDRQYVFTAVERRIAAVVVALATACVAGAGAQSPAAFAPIEPLVLEAIARGNLPGAVVLVGRGDTVVYRGAFGRRAVEPAPEAMTEDTIFDLASLTNVVATTTSVMQLVEQGRIRLRDPVAQFIPEFAAHGKSGVTIIHLLTHTSGLAPDLPLEVEFSGADEAVRRASDLAPSASPGERFVYSDINFFLLGDIVRRVSGERLDRYAKAHVFDPLGMKDTTFLPAENLRARIAPTERCRPMAWPCSDPAAPFLRGIVHDPTARRMDGVAGHAGLFSTAADLSRFCRMLLNGGI